jgi:hypothetical protein
MFIFFRRTSIFNQFYEIFIQDLLLEKYIPIYKMTVIPITSTKMQGTILFGLLVILFIIGMMLRFRSPEKEGYVDRTPLRFINQSSMTPPEELTHSDIENGFYVIERDANSYAIKKGQLPYGYYKIDADMMAKIPNGYELSPQGNDVNVDYMTKIFPRTNSRSAILSEQNKGKKIPANGEIPEGYYKKDEDNMAFLPPNTKPNIESLRITGMRNSPVLEKTYGLGYVTESEYYNKKHPLGATVGGATDYGRSSGESFPILGIAISRIGQLDPQQHKTKTYPTPDLVFPLPEGVYYTAPPSGTSSDIWKPDTIQFLPYGKIAKTLPENGTYLYGFVDNPNLISKDGSFKYSQEYRDISNNLDVTFHESAEDLAKKNDNGSEIFGDITVLDKDGNLLTLPRTEIHGGITYYTPGSYTFGAATYVPKYEDSVYLSRTSHLPTMAEYTSVFKEVGFCEANKTSPIDIDAKCSALSKDTCASTSCCVLLGSAKCVAGNEHGPSQKQHYSDILLRNRDSYTHMGKCYGNCP